MPGPPPKRDEERRRRNKDAVPTTKIDLDSLIAADVEVPDAPMRYVDEDGEELDEPEYLWQPTAVALYQALSRSGQAIFYEPSDWATAYTLCEQLSLSLEPRPVQIGTDSEGNPQYRTMVVAMPGGALSSLLKGLSSLMVTEGDRRRLRIELERKRARDATAAGDGKVVPISQQRQKRFTS